MNHAALTALHRAHYPDLVGYFVRRGAIDDADLLAAEVFVIAWQKMPSGLDAPRPWLFGVARKVLGNARRSHDRRHSLDVPIEDGPDDGDSPRITTHSGEVAFRVDLQRAWNSLGDDDQEILALTAWEGLTARQAASVLGIRRAAASMRLARAREHLREKISAPASRVRRATSGRSAPVEKETT
ncbi:RNA polymerase sigma factor [Frigoribacterium sp. 2-23]|uniref:RNA polymerase sigma factor n=1 Tax=Frigoribacterium sp. 2-23 TaxID=3415006 RepID=UPI003C6F4A2C